MLGVTNLEKLGPSGNNLYYDYYATQVLFHYGGSGWDGWNKKLREYLIAPNRRKATKTAVGISSTATATKVAGCTTLRWPF